MSLPYMHEPWFTMLLDAVKATSQSAVARQLGRSACLVNQVIKGGGAYGEGKASTDGIARRVLDTYGQWPCPYLGDGSDTRVISAAQCRTYAHREAPTGSPRDLAHWRACRTCPNKARSAPPVPRPVVPRPKATQPEGDPTATTAPGEPA